MADPGGWRLPRVALVGRVNVGKSTLFNRLVRQRRALVEDRPGVTRDRVAAEGGVEGRGVLFVDTGGLDPEAEDVHITGMAFRSPLELPVLFD